MTPNLPNLEIVVYNGTFVGWSRIPNVFLKASVASHSTNSHPKQSFPSPRREISSVNYPALLAPSRLAAVGHSLRAGLYRNDIVPRDPVHGRGPASYYRPRSGVGAILYASYSNRGEECPADLIPSVARNLRFLAANQNALRSGNVLALSPQRGGRESNPFAVVVPEYRMRYTRTTGASLLVAPTIPDLCRGSSNPGYVAHGLKCVRTCFLSALPTAESAAIPTASSCIRIRPPP